MSKLNQRELDILNILWNSKEPLIASAIVTKSDINLTQSTVTTVLRKLLKLGLVEVSEIKYSGKVLSRAYVPTPLSKDYLLKDFLESYQSFSNVISSVDMASALINLDADEYDTNELDQLNQLLNEFKKGKRTK